MHGAERDPAVAAAIAELHLHAVDHGVLERLEVLGRRRLGMVPARLIADDRSRRRFRTLPEGRGERPDELA